MATDARLDHPTVALPVTAISATGGMLARYTVRRDEFAASVALACHLIDAPVRGLTTSPRRHHLPAPRAAASGSSKAAGTIVHRVELDAAGEITRSKIVDPSWFNWPALPVAMANTIVPDFPLTNKSFNQSYAGNDL